MKTYIPSFLIALLTAVVVLWFPVASASTPPVTPTPTPPTVTLAPLESGDILIWYKSCYGRIEIQPDILEGSRVMVRCIGREQAPDESGMEY